MTKYKLTLLLTLISSLQIVMIDFQDYNSKILGTWVAEKGSIFERWVFTPDGKLTQYSDNQVSEIYNYSISGNSCKGGASRTNRFLHLVNVDDSNDQICYLLHGITTNSEAGTEGTYLSLEFHTSPKPILFKRQ